MRIRYFLRFCMMVFILGVLFSDSNGAPAFSKYHSPLEVASKLKAWPSEFPQLAQLHVIGTSSLGNNLCVLQIASTGKGKTDPRRRPAVFISANLEGSHLIGTEAALDLAEKLLRSYGKDKEITELLEKRTVYVSPLLNPDAALRYFSPVRHEQRTNGRPVDDDLDSLLDEDGPNDLNGDGWITQMRAKDPEGEWIPDAAEPRLLKKADPQKGEQGIYKLYSEGLDDDGDGEYNEDPSGGVEIHLNFPHDFDYDDKKSGLWPVSEKESIALLKFLTSHPNISMVLNFSSENTFLNLQQTGKAAAGSEKVKVPRRYAAFLGLEEDKEYTLQELVSLLKEMDILRGMEIDETLIATMLGLGPAMDLDRQDRPYMEAIQKDYKERLKEAGLDYPEKRARSVSKGSFVAYCYFQLGTQVFSSDLWAVPEPKKEEEKQTLSAERLKSMTSEEFLELGEEKIAGFLEKQKAPAHINAPMLINMVKSGRLTPEKMAEMMEKMPQQAGSKNGEHPEVYILHWSDSVLGGKGFVDWTPFKHPTLGEIEIGGFVPFLKTNPPSAEAEKTISFHTDFYLDLMKRLPQLEIKKIQVTPLDDYLFKVTAYFTNSGWFPTSTAQGRRARTAWPIRVKCHLSENQKLFSGKLIETVPFLDGSGDTKKIEWIIKGKKGTAVTVTTEAPYLDSVAKKITLQ